MELKYTIEADEQEKIIHSRLKMS